MADICKCRAVGCKMKEFCYRYTALSSERNQVWFAKTPIESNGDCNEYWEMKCPSCGQFNGIHKLSCATNKITIKL